MRTAFQNEDRDEAAEDFGEPDPFHAERQPNPDRELTVSATTLLTLFFGLVLLCALFFGLGYSLGRRTPPDAPVLAQASAAVSQSPLGSASKPSPSSQNGSLASSAPASSASDTPPPEPAGESDPTAEPQGEAASPKAEPKAPAALPKSGSPPVPAPSAPPEAAASSGTVVQVAAISNPADADVLVRALDQKGYSASARRFPPDPLIHVQIGPFANRAEAVAMRQKLQSDGYNAILK